MRAIPGDFNATYMLATVLHQQGKFAEALVQADAATLRNPSSSEAQMLRATALVKMGRIAEAVEGFRTVTARQPANYMAWYYIGVLLTQLNSFEDALKALDKALAVQPSADAWNARGVALQQGGRAIEAATCYAKAIALAPGQPIYHANHARALQAQGQARQAVSSYDKALALRPSDATSWHNRAVALSDLESYPEAIESAGRALALAPNDADALMVRANAFGKLGRYVEALADYDQTIALTPGNIDVRVIRARLLQTIQRFDAASGALDEIDRMRTDYPPALAARAALLCERSQFAAGLDAFRRHSDVVLQGVLTRAENDPGNKRRHDAEQDEWLAGLALPADGRFRIVGGERVDGAAVTAQNAANATVQWSSRKPQIAVVDDFLTPAALSGLRHFCLESTIWLTPCGNGYLGALPDRGFACPLLAQIAEELQSTFPDILSGLGLVMTWAFSYDSELKGINTHADPAAVNINFWLTPNEANNDAGGGGLIIWDKPAPPDWEFEKYSSDGDSIRKFLLQSDAQPTRVPYRANRAVIFDSDLFHETDTIDFKSGFENRRINVMQCYFGQRIPKA